ncbi:hypothetical protein BDZ89DRAFT_1065429 [Hymenopellis radicata]|nr:hypothetical protein BDZ89DRAFT_1065429 [Hymenopellis radicata]
MFSTASSTTTASSLRSSSSHERLRDATSLSSKRLSTVNEGCTSTSMSLHQYAYAEGALSPPPAHQLKHSTSRERLGLATLSECGSDGEGGKVRFHDACILIPRKPKKTRGRGFASLLPLPGRSPSRERPARLAPAPLPPCLRPSSVPPSPVTPDGRPGFKRADTLPLPDSPVSPVTRTPSPLTRRMPSPAVHRPVKETPKPLSSVKAFTRMARSSSFTMFLSGSAPTMSPSNPISRASSVKSSPKPSSITARKEKEREAEKCKLVPLRACCPDCVASTERAHKLEETFSAGARIVLHGLALELDVGQAPTSQQAEEEDAELFPVPNKRCSIMLKKAGSSSVTSLPSFPTPDEDDNDLFPLPSRRRCSVMVRKERVGSITSSICVDDDGDPSMDDEDDTVCADVPTIVIRPTSSHRRSISDGCFTWRWEEKEAEAEGLTVDSALQCLEGQRSTREKRATQLIVCPAERRKVAPWPEPHPGPDPSLISREAEEDNERERRKSRRLTWSANLLGNLKVVSVQ